MVKLFSCTSCGRNDESQEPSVQPLYPPYPREKYFLCPLQGDHIGRTHHISRLYDMPMRVAMVCGGVCIGVVSPITI